MRKSYILFFVSLVFAFQLNAQTYNQSTGNGVSNSSVTCAGNYYDNGGSGSNYSNNQASSYCFYPAVAGQYVSITFTAFNTQTNSDVLYIFDGTSGYLLGALTGTPSMPQTFTATNATGEICCTFLSNGFTTRPGWEATLSCSATPGTPPTFTNSAQDCMEGGGITVCGDATFSGNSSGVGNVNDLPGFANGCLSTEHQSSWYYFSPSAAGSVEFLITPANGTDDYDFALFGPFSQVSCPWNVAAQPLRCSYAAGGGSTGLQSGSGDNSEGAGGDRYVDPITVAADEVYVLVIDNFSSSSQPFDLDWTLSGGAALDCTTLPIELISFNGRTLGDNTNELIWITATETNNNFFSIERSNGEGFFETIGAVNGAGNSNQILEYSFIDLDPSQGYNYYRIKQTDFDGQTSFSPTLYIVNDFDYDISALYPNPTNNNFSLDVNVDGEEELQFIITDITGKQVSNQFSLVNKFKTVELNSSSLEIGIYFVSIVSSKNEIISTQKLIKE